MSQHDMIIDTHQSGTATRNDLEDGLQALASLSSGAVEPTTAYPYQLWADTTTGYLKIRNAANTAWIIVGTLASAFLGLLSLTTSCTIKAQHTFNPTSTVPPFIVGANGAGQAVTNLKAGDSSKLEGVTPSALILTLLDDATTAEARATIDVLYLDSALAVDHTYSGPHALFTAGESISAGNCCRINSAGAMINGDADALSTSGIIAMASADVATAASGTFILPGSFVRDDSWSFSSIGSFIYLSTTPGAFSQTAPSGTDDAVQIIGVAITAKIMYFNPQLLMYTHT